MGAIGRQYLSGLSYKLIGIVCIISSVGFFNSMASVRAVHGFNQNQAVTPT